MRTTGFRYCMLIGAVALASVSIFYFAKYVVLAIALQNSGVVADLQHSIRALWLAFACQGLLVALLYALVAAKPHAVSREVIVLLGLLHLVESVLQLTFAGSRIAAALLIVTALFVLVGAALWPRRLPGETSARLDAAGSMRSGG